MLVLRTNSTWLVVGRISIYNFRPRASLPFSFFLDLFSPSCLSPTSRPLLLPLNFWSEGHFLIFDIFLIWTGSISPCYTGLFRSVQLLQLHDFAFAPGTTKTVVISYPRGRVSTATSILVQYNIPSQHVSDGLAKRRCWCSDMGCFLASGVSDYFFSGASLLYLIITLRYAVPAGQTCRRKRRIGFPDKLKEGRPKKLRQ